LEWLIVSFGLWGDDNFKWRLVLRIFWSLWVRVNRTLSRVLRSER
jgi:hypothetical protein